MLTRNGGSRTHDLEVAGGILRKSYTTWDRGEHRREWAVLTSLHAHTHDLVPVPLDADLDTEPPAVTMSVVPGTSMGGTLTAAQVDGLEHALRSLWSVPVDGVPLRRFHPEEALAVARERYPTVRRPAGTPGEAYDAAVAFVTGPASFRLESLDTGTVVFGHSDPNLANYLWDGSRVRIVDFEDAGRSDLAYELATLAEHLSARGTDWEEFCTRFDVDAERLRGYRRMIAALWLHLLLPGGPAADRNPAGTLDAQAERLLALMG